MPWAHTLSATQTRPAIPANVSNLDLLEDNGRFPCGIGEEQRELRFVYSQT